MLMFFFIPKYSRAQLISIWTLFSVLILSSSVVSINFTTSEDVFATAKSLPSSSSSSLSSPSISSTVPSISLAIGDQFIVNWINDAKTNLLSLQVLSSPSPMTNGVSRVLWSSLNQQLFLYAVTGQDTIDQEGGNFKITQKITNVCTQQSVDAIVTSGASYNKESDDATFSVITISGTLTGPNSANCNLNYSLVFSTLLQLPQHLRFQVSITNTVNATASTVQNRIILTAASPETEKIFGMGQQYTYWNLKGKAVPVLSREQGIGRGDEPITEFLNLYSNGAGGNALTQYAAVPHFITTSNTSFFIENYEYSLFNFEELDRVSVEVLNTTMVGRILLGNSILELVSQYTLYSGRMSPLPQWIHSGAVVGLQGGEIRVLSIFDQLRSVNTSVSALWLQDWSGTRNQTVLGNEQKRLWWNWEVDTGLYPDWTAMIANLNVSFGVKVMSYINPFLVDVSLKPNYTTNYFKQAASLGYFVKNITGDPYLISSGPDFVAGQIDLTNPAARVWYKSIIKQNMIGPGACGWMADFGEYLQFDAVLADGTPASSFHNQYPQEWAKLNNEAVSESGQEGNVVYFSRSGSALSPSYAKLFWLGDQLPSWDEFDGLKTAVLGMLTSGLSGYSLQHSDIGGYTTVNILNLVKYVRSKELLLRWSEMSMFTTVFRTHEGSIPDLNAQVYSDNETLAFFSAYSQIYASLKDYRVSLVLEATQLGYPVVRHPILHYPSDENVFELKYQFMLGSSIMFAPVTTAGATSVYVYLPAGFWRSIHSTSVIIQSTGQSFSVDASLGCPAAFISVTPSNECTNDLLKEFINTVPKILQACSEITWSRI